MNDEVRSQQRAGWAADEEALVESALAAYGERARAEANRPEAFWRYQREAIASRLALRRGAWRMWAAATAMIVLVAVLLSVTPKQRSEVVSTDPDHELLVDVERSLRREVPRALEPAALLTQEISRATETRSNP